MRVILYIFILALLAGCKAGKPRGVIGEGKMERILYEYHLARALSSMGDSSNIKGRAYILACFKKNGVTEAEFDSSYVWYCQHMDILQKVYQRVSDRLRSELDYMGAATNDVTRYSNLATTGDTANIWNGRAYYLLTPNGFDNRFVYEVQADTAFRPGDTFMLNFRAQFVQKEGMRHAVAALAVQYDNDSIGYVDYHLYGSGDNSIRLATAERKVKRVYGYLYVLGDWSSNARLLFIFQPSLIRMHKIAPKEDKAKGDSLRKGADSVIHTPEIAPKPLGGDSGHSSVAPSLNPALMHTRPQPRSSSMPANK